MLPIAGADRTHFIDLPSSAAEEAIQFRDKAINRDISPQIVIDYAYLACFHLSTI
jgi:hypothetical protein